MLSNCVYFLTRSGCNIYIFFAVDSGDLTIENFTFCKEALGLNDPTKEIIRDAKKILSKVSMSCMGPFSPVMFSFHLLLEHLCCVGAWWFCGVVF
jgi:hypothetical protein